MTIGIILHPYNEKQPAGLGRYIFELTRHLIEIGQNHRFIIYTKNEITEKPFKYSNVAYQSFDYNYFWLERTLKRAKKSDIYIFNTPVVPLFYRPKNCVVIALDFAYREMRAENFRGFVLKHFLNYFHKFGLKKAKLIIAISEYAKKEVIDILPEATKKIKVVYPGYNKPNIPENCNNMIDGKYFLYVGVIKERKNLLRMLEAFNSFARDFPDYSFAIVGKGGGQYFEKVISFIKKHGGEKVKYYGYLDEGRLACLLKNAQALLYVSLIEGFGFPVLEAQSLGIPVITSNTSSLKEVALEGALLVDPLDLTAIRKAMSEIASDQELKNRLIKGGEKNTQRFNWQKCAREFLDAIKT